MTTFRVAASTYCIQAVYGSTGTTANTTGRINGSPVILHYPDVLNYASIVPQNIPHFPQFGEEATPPTILNAEEGTYILSGQTASLKTTRLLSAETGLYSLSGQVAGLKLGRRVLAGQGAYDIVGQSATLTFLASSGGKQQFKFLGVGFN